MKKLLIIDGNSILNRAFYGIRPLNAPDGTPTNAVYGFLNIYFKQIEEKQPDYVCVAFDLKAPTFRHKLYDQYKAQRKPAPEDLIAQLPVIKEVLHAMNCCCLELEGYEADDIIGTISRRCEEENIQCRILAGDKDDLQLASDLTKVDLVITRMGSTTTTEYGAAEVLEKYGVTPAEFIDVKGLMGDPSDNIPGVKGIGEKTAFALIQSYKSIDAIYQDLDTLDVTKSVKSKLEAGKEQAYLSRKLATIERNIPISFSFSDTEVRSYDDDALARLFTRLNFRSFLTKLHLTAQKAPEAERPKVDVQFLDAEEAVSKISGWEKVYYLFADSDPLHGLCFSGGTDAVYIVEKPNLPLLKALFENKGLAKVGYDLKEDIVRLHALGISYQNLAFDVMVAAYLIDPSETGYRLERLSAGYLGYDLEETEGENGGQISMEIIAPDKQHMQAYGAKLTALIRLEAFFKDKLAERKQEELYQNIELPLIEVLADMQIAGVYVDKAALHAFGEELEDKINQLTAQIYEEAGEEFNLNSPKQLGGILFEKLGLPHGKKTKTGYSTNVETLQKLEPDHAIVAHILEYRQLSKLQSTYVKGLLSVIDQQTGRIHSNFNQTVTATGRISSTEPNLQNIPVRTPLGREIRRMFTAGSEDKVLVDADYSQIELRVLAHISDDENMQHAFLEGDDIHTQTAAQVFGVLPASVTPLLRTRAKAVNFGIIYGIGAFSLSQDLHITRKEADAYIQQYLNHYPKVALYMKETVAHAREKGYVTTMFGRRRYLPELKAANRNTQAFGERVAMNAPIQGSAADIIKIAMVNVYRRLKREGLASKLILQIHDELIVEAEREELEQVRHILKEEMEQACQMRVPLVVDMKDGHSWYDTK